MRAILRSISSHKFASLGQIKFHLKFEGAEMIRKKEEKEKIGFSNFKVCLTAIAQPCSDNLDTITDNRAVEIILIQWFIDGQLSL